ncbi:MAG: carbonate dehydratase [Gammaproteobacteria bacterium]|nr:carbonate dehydratase [Gammaproteobacteria bacterium]
MKAPEELLQSNKVWAARMRSGDPDFFDRLATQQTPQYLWIGCSDSRVPATQIVDMAPGEMFVHRNIANVVLQTDLNCLSVLQFAIEVLGVRHIIVCGHYGCGGVQAAMDGRDHGLIDNWLRQVQDIAHRHAETLGRTPGDQARRNRLCELNVLEQVRNVCRTTVVRKAWESGRDLTLHGWIYDIHNGELQQLTQCVNPAIDATAAARNACRTNACVSGGCALHATPG